MSIDLLITLGAVAGALLSIGGLVRFASNTVESVREWRRTGTFEWGKAPRQRSRILTELRRIRDRLPEREQ